MKTFRNWSERCSLHAVALLDPIWIDKWHQLFPAHWKVGPAPVFWASRQLEPAEWLALLILKAGDVESNPGPQNRKLTPSALTTQTTTLNSTTHSHATTSHHNKKLLMHTNKNHTISFNNKPSVTSTQIANSFNKQFTNTVPHTSNKTNRKIDKQVHKLPKTTFILTTSEISAAIRNSKNNNSTGPDGISIRHLKHIGPLGLTYLTNTFNLALNTNTIPHM